MSVEEAKTVIDHARNRGAYIDIEEPDLAILDGHFTVSVLEAIVLVMRAGVPCAVRWSGENPG
jgi:hypothetical protein